MHGFSFVMSLLTKGWRVAGCGMSAAIGYKMDDNKVQIQGTKI